MAAVLCKGIGDLCKALGEVICLPCKCVGVGCQQIGDVLSTPFFCYIAVTYVCNIPPLIFGARGIMNGWCRGYTSWLLVNVIGAILHLVSSVYIASKISSNDLSPPQDSATPTVAAVTGVEEGEGKRDTKSSTPVATGTPEPSSSGTNLSGAQQAKSTVQNFFSLRENEHGAPNSSTRIKHILCFDGLTAVYMLVFIAWFVWLCIGISRIVSSTDYDADECVDDQVDLIKPSLICGFVYLSLFWCTFCCSLCCLK